MFLEILEMKEYVYEGAPYLDIFWEICERMEIDQIWCVALALIVNALCVATCSNFMNLVMPFAIISLPSSGTSQQCRPYPLRTEDDIKRESLGSIRYMEKVN